MSRDRLSKILGPRGLLASKIQQFHFRASQLSMAQAIERAIVEQQDLIAEAATGTGKTFAYLVPALLSGKKILISTATKTLQDQLVVQDLPKILGALGLSRTVQNLKGRDNYLCKYRLHHLLSQASAYQLAYYHELSLIHEQLPVLDYGEKSELQGLPAELWFWPEISARADHCLAGQCPMQAECFLYRARQRAMGADCVVVNHHLFFADSRLKMDGFGALLPAFEVIIFDEAHQMVDIAILFYSQSFTTASLLRLVQDLSHSLALSLKDIFEVLKTLELSVHDFLSIAPSLDNSGDLLSLIHREQVPCLFWQQCLQTILSILDGLSIEQELVLMTWKQKIQAMLVVMNLCLDAQGNGIAWMQILERSVRFQWSPFSIVSEMRALLQDLQATVIFTSATLKTQGHFSWFQSSLGLEEVRCCAWDSPYDWSKQAMLYIPHELPDVYHAQYYELLVQRVLPIIELLQGKTLFLFTSHKALNRVASYLPQCCHYPLFVQGQMEKTLLLESFRKQQNGILLGTGSFWEGVDIRGHALSCVVIDKLPFANIVEPWLAAKLRYLKQQGVAVFEDYLIPQAILSLKQGIGRLIRTETDKGVLVMGDLRLLGRAYGRDFKQSLPPLLWTRSWDKVQEFIETLDACVEHEDTII